MDRLQAVAGVRQRPVHDGRERVGEIALLERLLAAGWSRCPRPDGGSTGLPMRRTLRANHASRCGANATSRTRHLERGASSGRGECDETRPLLRATGSPRGSNTCDAQEEVGQRETGRDSAGPGRFARSRP